MPWKTINLILGLAATNQQFCHELLRNPLEAALAQNFELTQEEQHAFKKIVAQDLVEFSQKILLLLGPDV